MSKRSIAFVALPAVLLPLAAMVACASPGQTGKAPACVLRSGVAAPVVRDDGKLYFRGQPDQRQSYIAVFKGGDCPGLNRFAAVIVESSGDRYCEGDKVRAIMTPSQVPGPRCVIDRLQPFSGAVDDPITAAPDAMK